MERKVAEKFFLCAIMIVVVYIFRARSLTIFMLLLVPCFLVVCVHISGLIKCGDKL